VGIGQCPLSKFSTHRMGFGMHEAMDQSGAVAGPLLVSVILYLQ